MKRIFCRAVLLLGLTAFLPAGCCGMLPEHPAHTGEVPAGSPITLEISIDPSDPETVALDWGPSGPALASAVEETEVTVSGGEAGGPSSVTVKIFFRDLP